MPKGRGDGSRRGPFEIKRIAIASVRAHGVRQLLVYCLGKHESYRNSTLSSDNNRFRICALRAFKGPARRNRRRQETVRSATEIVARRTWGIAFVLWGALSDETCEVVA